MRSFLVVAAALLVLSSPRVLTQDLTTAIAQDYDAHLAELFMHVHRNPELAFTEVETAARMAKELAAAGFTVTAGVGRTGVVALMENGPGPRA